ncbi:hypothetical protein [Halomonas sp. E19]|uniref:hypothetical protein n=1 Tax=Halomonas sp. E19 TaxID=3397247 RepID=UPI0040346120
MLGMLPQHAAFRQGAVSLIWAKSHPSDQRRETVWVDAVAIEAMAGEEQREPL